MTVRRVAQGRAHADDQVPAAVTGPSWPFVAAFGRRPTPSSPTSTAANGCGTGSSTRGGGAS
jgi:hypothetical protein